MDRKKKKSRRSQVYPHISKSIHGNQGYFLEDVSPPDEPILLMIWIVLQTAFLKAYEKPISLLLIGKPGIGKSRLLSPLADLPFVAYVNDITPKYLVEFLEKVKRGEKKFLVIPDFTSCLSHGKSTKSVLIAILRSMTEEGVRDLSNYHLEFKSDKHVRAGLITAITSSSYSDFSRSWKKTGFLSRLLPISFKHSVSTTLKIMNEIDSKKPDTITKIHFKIRKTSSKASTPPHLLRQLRCYEENLSKETESEPYRPQIQLNEITESLAVIRGDSEIRQEDIDTIARLSKWINYCFEEI